MTSHVVSLNEATDVSKFGGKAANLAILLQNKVLVPEGVVVAVTGFDSKGGLLTSCREHIQDWLKTQPKGTKYAVRSSALNEDGQDQSWAGQFDTYLDVSTGSVVAKVEDCHNTIGARAKAYGGDKNKDFKVAVIVQRMIKPDYAGVLFTQNPVDGSNQMIIEYIKGLAEQLVSGQVTPESCIWDRESGTLDSDVPFDAQELIDIALAIEKIYQAPQDIEWTVQNNKFYIVQTRPITTLGET